jgi:pimeloyl-ACP methyl ester carboxylesterase
MEYVQAGGHRLELERIEPAVDANGPSGTLVFLHEGLGSTALWKDFPERVARRTGCPAAVYSRYGYGKSDRLERAHAVDYMHREALDTLPELLSQLAIVDPILIGHSDGASIALIYAGAQRGPLRGLVAMAPHVFLEAVTVASIAQARVAFETTDLPQRLGRYHDDSASTFYGWNDTWLHPEFRAWNIEAYLPKIAVPILLIQGEDDQYGTRAQVDAIAQQVCGPVEVLMLDQCGHSPHIDRADATAEAIAVFVGRSVKGEG